MSVHPVAVDLSRTDPGGPSTVQIEMTATQAGLRNRVRQTPDGLAHLNSEASSNRSADMSSLRSIACALVRLDAWALNTIWHSYTTNPQLVGSFTYDQFKVIVSDDVNNLVNSNNIYEDRFENDVQNSLEELSDERILEILCDLRTSTHYAQFIQLRTLLYRTEAVEHKYAVSASNLTVPENPDWNPTPQQYLRYLTIETSENRMKLKSVVTGCRDFLDRIKYAAELGQIAPTVLEVLKKKMQALQVNYREACIEVEINSYVLINPDIAQWWNPGDEAIQATGLNASTSNAAQAYPRSSSVSATLSFLVPTICLLSCIPAGLAWSHTPSQVGAYDDGNFYQLICSSAMQLLGIGTLIWPTVFSARLVSRSRIWTWVLRGTSIISTVISMPLYLYAPTAWSGLLSFCGNVAQALALLQLVHSL